MRLRALLAAGALALAGLGVGAGSAGAAEQVLGAAAAPPIGAAPAIVGGGQIDVSAAPWQVFLEADAGGGSVYDCGGSILDPTTIVTAAHCVLDPRTGARFTAARLRVWAGSSQAQAGVARGVADIRIHPYYQAAPGRVAPDDVAVLTLSGSLAFSSTIRAIPLVAAGAYPAVGTIATITGFGRQAAGGRPDGKLYTLQTAIGDQLACGAGANAIILCVSSATGSACEGDSGGPISAGGVLLGVASFVQLDGPTGECGVASLNGYTNLAAPEIREFVVNGSSAPPRAPTGGRDISARGIFQARQAVTCTAGTWTDAPAFLYAFIDTASGALLQLSGSDTYTFTDGDVGRTVACEVRASNAGGTALARTLSSPPIAIAPPPPPPPRTTTSRPSLRLSVAVPRGKVRKGARVTHAIKVANRGDAAARDVVVCDRPGGGLGFAKLPKGARKARGRACLTLGTIKAGAARTVKVTLKVAGRASRGTHVNAVTLSAANASRRSVTARVVVR